MTKTIRLNHQPRRIIVMSIKLNHTIAHSHNKAESATFLAEILGLPEPIPFGHFLRNCFKTQFGFNRRSIKRIIAI